MKMTMKKLAMTAHKGLIKNIPTLSRDPHPLKSDCLFLEIKLQEILSPTGWRCTI
jgi:hypothetical protein